LKLQARYHHVLVDEFQDTSRAQWELISLLVQSWGQGAGLASSGPIPPSIFIVGDRKQSIYAFRDADVSILDDARIYIERLRPGGDTRRAIAKSFRSVPALLAFINDVAREVHKADGRRDAFRYVEDDQFPVDDKLGSISGEASNPVSATPLGLVTADAPEDCAETTAIEIQRLLAEGVTVRDKTTGVPRPITAADVAILFRTRDSHREFEAALERHGIGAYVYKGLGFFDADEIKDVIALLWYLADPLSDLRAAALLRSRFFRLSDEALRRLAPNLAAALRSPAPPAVNLDPEDELQLTCARDATARWRGLVDGMPPAELLDVVLAESAYFIEMRGPRWPQARENLKKIRALIRRIQNRGYVTLGRIAAHLDRLAVGDESNAVIDALDAVNLMTVHASKGLEFPVVFVVNLARGTGNFRDPIRVVASPGGDDVSVAVGDFRSDADEDDAAKEREETKRLLYVALTRARDRLYLVSVLKEGRVQPGRGSLAEVLPPSLVDVFAAGDQWCAASGTVHRFCRCDSRRIEPRTLAPSDAPSHPAPSHLEPLPSNPVVSVASVTPSATEARDYMAPLSDRLVGTLVHRLLQRFGFAIPSNDLPDLAWRLLRDDEVDGGDGIDSVVAQAVANYSTICGREDVRDLYAAGPTLHEVPFTTVIDGRVLRGSVDCLVETAPGHLTVLEFKTGRPRPEHQKQLAIYQQAMKQAFVTAIIDALLIYSEKNDNSQLGGAN
jgi:ATP-dependent helicase/nuclease subunit A